jgi:flagellar hook-length control protein FliK
VQRTVDLAPTKTIASREQHPAVVKPASGLQSTGFKQALGEQLGELEGHAGGGTTEMIGDPCPDLAFCDGTQKDPFLPALSGLKPVTSPLDQSAIAKNEPKALLQALILQAQAPAPDVKRPIITHIEQAPTQEGARCTLKNSTASKSHSADSPSSATNGSAQVAASVPALITEPSTVPSATRSAADVASATIRSTSQAGALKCASDSSGGNGTDPGEIAETASEPQHATSSSPLQLPDRLDVRSVQAGDSMTIDAAARIVGNQLAASGRSTDSRLQKADQALNTKNAGLRENASVDPPATAIPAEAQSSSLETEIRSFHDTRLLTVGHAISSPSASQASVPSHSPIDGGPIAPRIEGSSPSTFTHLTHASSTIPSRLVDPYQKMEQVLDAPASVTSAAANRVAVGLHDPALGWVEIKTQSTGGQIAAALVASSTQSHQTLAAQLPSMAQFLSDREIRISSIAVEQQTLGGSLGDRTGSGSESQSNPNSSGDSTPLNRDSVAPTIAVDAGVQILGELGPLSHISVMA